MKTITQKDVKKLVEIIGGSYKAAPLLGVSRPLVDYWCNGLMEPKQKYVDKLIFFAKEALKFDKKNLSENIKFLESLK